MPAMPMPFPNNSAASPHSCTHYDLIVAVGVFTLPRFMTYYHAIASGAIGVLMARASDGFIVMRRVHRDALSLILSPDSVFFKMRKCSMCGRISLRMKRCCRCTGHYCNVVCQRCDWPEHRDMCDHMFLFVFNNGRLSPHDARLAVYQRTPLCLAFRSFLRLLLASCLTEPRGSPSGS